MNYEKQLIYLWINNDERGCFRDSEFNFNPKYGFHFDKNENNLTVVKKESNINLFENDNVCNLTAIIGNNGVGKTTLFKRIFNLPFVSVEKNKSFNNPKYKKFGDQNKENNYYIAVFLINKHRLKVINNYKTPITFEGETIQQYRKRNDSDKTLSDITRVFLSFSSYGDNEIETSYAFKEHNRFFLNPTNIEIEGHKYLDRVTPIFKKSNIGNELINYFKQSFNFENVLIAKSLCSVEEKNKLFSIGEMLKFSFLNLINELLSNEKYSRFDKQYIFENLKVRDRIIDEQNIFFLIKTFLRIELMEAAGFYSKSPKEAIDDEEAWEEQKDFISRLSEETDKEISDYFKKAVKEITLLESFSRNFSMNLLPITDSARRVEMVLDKKDANRLFELMMGDETPSFLLKYLKINIGMSAGEIAFARMIAYFDYLFKIKKVGKERERPRHNIIVMLDEPDVSLHPQAKVDLIKKLMFFVKKYMPKKNVQIMITSHSPIVLSDIPNNNVIYLKRSKNELTNIIYSDKKTFGSSIIDLYSDTFYFDNKLPMGSFAKDYINSLYEKMCDKRISEEEKDSLLKKVDLIGDELIRNQFNADFKKQEGKESISKLEKIELELKHFLKRIQRMKEDD